LTAVSVNALGVGSFNPALAVVDTCASTACGAYSNVAGLSETLSLRNTDPTASRTFVVSVIDEAAVSGTYTLSTTATAIAPNGTCATSTALTVGVAVTGESIVGGGAPIAVCQPTAPRPNAVARHYSVVVPGNTLVTVTASAVGFDPAVSVVDSCTATACTSAVDTLGVNETVLLRNTTSTAVTYQLSVIDQTGVGGTFSLTSTSTPIASCASPAALSLGTLSGQLISSGGPAPTACLPLSTGPTVFFSVLVPPGETRLVRVNSTGTPTFNPSLRVLDSCSATTCVASNDVTGSIETVSFSNSGSVPVTSIVAVGSGASTSAGTFAISLSRPAYVVSRPPSACVDLSTAPDVAFSVGSGAPNFADDVATGSLALPFPLTFFGTAVTHASYTSNGLMQVTVGPGASVAQTARGITIPNPAAPNNLIAGFWDDLTGSPASGASLRTLVTGTSPNRRFTIQWANVGPFTLMGPERVTFQVQLVETTNVIEFHYCAAAANGGTSGFESGARAFIGVEDATGSDQSISLSERTPGSVRLTQAYRLTP
jgi:hypothetical protein